MNPRKEFVNAIMSVLRLEQNIYVTASIEEIIDRIDIQDYTIFIAYLGERSSDFERPIQTIAKATEDFYEKKHRPKRIEISNYADRICTIIYGARSVVSANKKDEYLKEHNKERFSTIEECDAVIEANNAEVFDFIHKVKSIGNVNIKGILPTMDKIGGVAKLIELSNDNKTEFRNYIAIELGVEKYQQLSISEKIDKDAKDGISGEMLKLVNNALSPRQYL